MKFNFYLFLLFLPFWGQAQIQINEACSSNKDVIFDEYGESSDWIELYNNSNTTVNLEGSSLSDDINELNKWTFPDISIAPNEFLVVFASDEDICDVNCHTNFKLSSSGETIYFSSSDGNLLSSMELPDLNEDLSYGRETETSEQLVYFNIPTPGFGNNNGSQYELSPQPYFIDNNYFHSKVTQVKIACEDSEAVIYYTLDGSRPTENSKEYKGTIVLDTSTFISAISIVPGKEASKILKQTFFIETKHSLPIISISSDPKNFWDYENGIFEYGPEADTVYPYYGANFWKDIEIPIHMEYYVDQSLVYSGEIGTKVHGGKAARNNKMKALRLVTDGDYSTDGMNYPFFENKDIDNYRRLVLRNASGDYNYTHFRDAYLHRYFINENLDIDVLADQPVVCYINGIYWGVMHLREKIDRFYLNENYDYKKSEIDLLEEDLFIIEGDTTEYINDYNFIVSNDMSITENYEQASSKFDISSLIDFWIAQSFINNTDFPENNIKFWQPKEIDGKWRYLLFDMDVGMGRHGWTKANQDNFSDKLANENNNKFINILLALYKNQEFKHRFINRYCDLMNSTFREELFLKETISTASELYNEMDDHFNKWGWPGFDVWYNDRLPKLYSFVEERPDYQREFIRDYFELEKTVNIKLNVYPPEAGTIEINSLDIVEFPWNGYYYKGVPVNITINENAGYSFSRWQSLNNIITQDKNISLSIDIENDDEITAIFSGDGVTLSFEVITNPIIDDINVRFILSQKGNVQIDLIDLNGRIIQVYNFQEMNAGLQKESLSVPYVNAGTYFVRLRTNELTETKKIIIYNP